ncbi:MAG: endolytic transglycosylase MltG [Muribaculaceae bacterium]|nr:endolytic transglycosylase MltG [Muribaculaceae bacterium]
MKEKNTPSDTSAAPQGSGSAHKPVNLARIALWVTAILVVLTFFLVAPILIMGTDNDAIIRIPDGATREMVRDSLAKYFGDSYATRVDRLIEARNTDMSRRNGAYRIRKGDTPFNAMRRLTGGSQEPVRITVNGFRSLSDLTERIGRRMEFPADSLRHVLADTTLMSRYNLTPEQALSLFVEDSYDVYWSSDAVSFTEKIGHHYINVWNGRRRAEAAALGLTPAEVMIIASIVDEESNKRDEKGRIGRLYINRLKAGMPLQADPTVRFALGDFSIRRITGEHLKTQSPYNTYLHKGLPPGPIRTTSTATIDAILGSLPSEDLYMCAREDFSGYHNFTSDYDEHLANARRYQEQLNRKNIH